MTQITTSSLGTIQWDAMPSEMGHIETGISNAWQGPEIWMWHERFVCPGPYGWIYGYRFCLNGIALWIVHIGWERTATYRSTTTYPSY